MSKCTNSRTDISVESVDEYLARGGVIHVIPPLHEVKQTLGEEQYLSHFREQYIDTPQAGMNWTPLFPNTPKRGRLRVLIEDGTILHCPTNHSLDATERFNLIEHHHPHD